MSREVARVLSDERRGHISVLDERGAVLLSMTADGDRLDVWQHEGFTLTPETACALSHELESWAGLRVAMAARRA